MNRQDEEQADIRMRSFAPGASGRLRIDATTGGGRARLTALKLPRPGNFASTANSYVVWAVSEGRFVRLGHLETDANGNGGLEFTRPAEFDSYSVIVTAEPTAQAERPAGSPVLSTRAAEARALFSSDKDADRTARQQSASTTSGGGGASKRTSKSARLVDKSPWPRSSRAGDFYSDVENALDAQGGGQLLELFGTDVTPGAEGAARVAVRTGTGFARARFLSLPAPSTLGANVYVMWGVQPDGRIIYMGSLPTDLNLDVQEIYLRTAGFTADEYSLYLTAERQRPVHQPSNVRVLETRYHVK
ncbi:MAG TPA: hypothetical protein VGB73_05810 [Pyrinomonadaceae bacterium]